MYSALFDFHTLNSVELVIGEVHSYNFVTIVVLSLHLNNFNPQTFPPFNISLQARSENSFKASLLNETSLNGDWRDAQNDSNTTRGTFKP